ncbi:MAG TPA: grasp-with-spasm system ATP-grasp peptide maturase [Puia sp.]
MSIVIISSEQDASTDDVIGWIRHYGKIFYRINETSAVSVVSIDIAIKNKLFIEMDDQRIDLDEIDSFWYRRDNFAVTLPAVAIKRNFPFKKEIELNLQYEKKRINEYIHFKLLQKRSIGSYFRTNINKLITLEVAREVGISVPRTLVTTRKRELAKFRENNKDIICKAISEAIHIGDINFGYIYNYTHVLSDSSFDKLNETFPLSLFQNKIDKEYELRIFYLNGDFYTMAIFSQSDTQTSVDFRRYNSEKPNRTVPYTLPPAIKERLAELMNRIGLNTGSIDMAVSQNKEYVFFEVNPIGQFGMTSYPCNYYLEKKIAEYLINE